jgi:hypothetical protein
MSEYSETKRNFGKDENLIDLITIFWEKSPYKAARFSFLEYRLHDSVDANTRAHPTLSHFN